MGRGKPVQIIQVFTVECMHEENVVLPEILTGWLLKGKARII